MDNLRTHLLLLDTRDQMIFRTIPNDQWTLSNMVSLHILELSVKIEYQIHTGGGGGVI